MLINLEKIASHKPLMKKLAEIAETDQKHTIEPPSPSKRLISRIAKFLNNNIADVDYEECTDQFLRFCKKMSQQSLLQKPLYEHDMHGIALMHIRQRQKNFSREDQRDEAKLKSHLQTVQNVMKMIKHLFEGAELHEKHRIVEKVEAQENRELIEQVDSLLQQYKGNDDMAVMIVKIISCFNSISNNMKEDQVRDWIQDFSDRLIEASKPSLKKGPQSSYMERYVFILELLVTKNLDKIDMAITERLLSIYESDTKHFSKTIWYKMLKILAHLINLQELMAGDNKIEMID